MLTKGFRLSEKKDFKRIYKQKKAFSPSWFTVKYVANDLNHSRLAVVISKRTMAKAVDRNYQKRRLHVICQKLWPRLKKNIDIIIIGKKKLNDLSFNKLQAELTSFFQQQKLI